MYLKIPTANFILNGEGLNHFPLRLRPRLECLLIQLSMEVSVIAIKKKRNQMYQYHRLINNPIPI